MKKNGFIDGALLSTISIIVTKSLGLLYVIPFYKLIGQKGGELYSYAYNLYAIFLAISMSGLPSSISKIISEYDAIGYNEAKVRTFKIAKKLISYISLIAFFIMFLFAPFFAKVILGNINGNNIKDVTLVIRSISFAILVVPYISVSKGFLQGNKFMFPTSVSNILEQIIRISIILLGSFISIKILKLNVVYGVCIAVSGAFFGGLVSKFYLKYIIHKNKKVLKIRTYKRKNKVSNNEILGKIIKYSLPFVIISIATNIYAFTDMVLILRGLTYIGLSASDAEFIQSAITTWSNKICMIISSLSLGLSISLIPNIVSSNVRNKTNEIEINLNKAYQIILVVGLPASIGLFIISSPVWTVFYGYNKYGSMILKFLVFNVLLSTIYNITLNTMQSLNKFKIVYISTILGFIVNATLDIPIMLLLFWLKLPPYLGFIFASIIGFTLSIKVSIYSLKRDYNIRFNETKSLFKRLIIPLSVMILILFVINNLIKFNTTKIIPSFIMIFMNMIIGSIVYLLICHKLGILKSVFGEKYEMFIKKLILFK